MSINIGSRTNKSGVSEIHSNKARRLDEITGGMRMKSRDPRWSNIKRYSYEEEPTKEKPRRQEETNRIWYPRNQSIKYFKERDIHCTKCC